MLPETRAATSARTSGGAEGGDVPQPARTTDAMTSTTTAATGRQANGRCLLQTETRFPEGASHVTPRTMRNQSPILTMNRDALGVQRPSSHVHEAQVPPRDRSARAGCSTSNHIRTVQRGPMAIPDELRQRTDRMPLCVKWLGWPSSRPPRRRLWPSLAAPPGRSSWLRCGRSTWTCGCVDGRMAATRNGQLRPRPRAGLGAVFAGGGRRVVSGPGSGLSEEPVPGV